LRTVFTPFNLVRGEEAVDWIPACQRKPPQACTASGQRQGADPDEASCLPCLLRQLPNEAIRQK
ncbi:MAG: hypothetical protein ACK53V_22895, partial [Planctomycetota bacterium]